MKASDLIGSSKVMRELEQEQHAEEALTIRYLLDGQAVDVPAYMVGLLSGDGSIVVTWLDAYGYALFEQIDHQLRSSGIGRLII